MRYHVLATDYDGTLATDERVPAEVIEALKSLKASGRTDNSIQKYSTEQR